jgi:hypothetical protein
MWWKRIKSAWSAYRQVAAFKGLLQTIGLWRYVTLSVALGVGALSAFWVSLPLPFRVLFGLADSALLIFLAGFVVCLVRVVRSENSPNRKTTLPPPTGFVAPMFPLPPNATGIGRPLPSSPTPPLSEDECYACWSDAMSSPKALWLSVYNNTPNSSYCTVTVVSIHRWSEKQKQFIDTRTHHLGFAFEVYKGMAVPERTNRAEKLVIRSRTSFEILGLERHRSFRRSDRGRWRIGLLLKLGTRERRQELCFKWNTSGLSRCRCYNSENLLYDQLAPQLSSDVFGTDRQSPESATDENSTRLQSLE